MNGLTPIVFIGADSDSMTFQTKSWSGTGETYEIDVSKRDGWIHCSCMDATCRHKSGHVLKTEDRTPCKHVRRLLHMIGGVLRPSEETNGTEN